MTKEELWQKKSSAFEQEYFKDIGGGSQVRMAVLIILQQAQIHAIAYLLSNKVKVTKDSFYGACSTCLDNISVGHKFPIFSHIQFPKDKLEE